MAKPQSHPKSKAYVLIDETQEGPIQRLVKLKSLTTSLLY